MSQAITDAREPATVSGAVNGIEMEALRETLGAIEADPSLARSKFRARNTWIGGNLNRTTITEFYAAGQDIPHASAFQLQADEPALLAGGDSAPNPVEHLLNALVACLTTSLVAHAAVRGINIYELESEVEGDIDLTGYLGLSNDVPRGYTDIRVNFKVKSDAENMDMLKRLALFSPVFSTITQGANVDVRVSPSQVKEAEK
ncbi:MAG: OsmC family protein [Gemmatimonadota bacterium]